jgi:aminopeptidase N
MSRTILIIALGALLVPGASAQLLGRKGNTTRADTLRGSIGPERAWWNVLHYDVHVAPDIHAKTIKGRTVISFEATGNGQRMQVDLQQPLEVDSITTEVAVVEKGGIVLRDRAIPFEREGNVLWVALPQPMRTGEAATLAVYYGGKPRAAKNPPWDGGWIWKTDAKGNPWVSVACQGLGASVWYPCKDHQSDEPDNGADLRITVPDSLTAVGNGRLVAARANGDGTSTWHWRVSYPINTYNLVPYIGKYTRFGEVYEGADGPLDLDHWVLEHNAEKARKHFGMVPGMLACFEGWMGPFPFYNDSYKLVESPHLGMEHQSAIAYGNNYVNGYMGQDLSGTGHGLDWDYIIVHESGHEWYGNNISTADIADMWVHEGFTMYTEVLFVECTKGVEAAQDYVVGIRRNIRNDRPVIGPYGVNKEGSGDMYSKGANLVHLVRHLIGDDARFKTMLREMNTKYRHGIVTSAEIEHFMDGYTAVDLRPVFDQYLRSRQVPVLERGVHKGRLYYRWTACNEGFTMPVRLIVDGRDRGVVACGTTWRALDGRVPAKARVEPDRNWYVGVQAATKAGLKEAAGR